MCTDRVSLVQDLGACCAIFVDQGICILDWNQLIIDSVVEESLHGRNTVRSHDTIGADNLLNRLAVQDIIVEVAEYVLTSIVGDSIKEVLLLNGKELVFGCWDQMLHEELIRCWVLSRESDQ